VTHIVDPTKIFNENELEKLADLKSEARKAFGSLPWAGQIILAGGAFSSWFHEEEPKDIDVFVLWNDELSDHDDGGHRLVLDTYRREFPWLEQQPSKYRQDVNPNITDVWGSKEKGRIQLIFTKYKTRKEMVDHFDYAHAMVSYGYGEAENELLSLKLFISRQTYDCIRDRTLIINNKENWRQYREDKFVERGWAIGDKDRLEDLEKENAAPWHSRPPAAYA
jgi:hypothetical protein